MIAPDFDAVERHVTAAKVLLAELDEQTVAAIAALGHDDGGALAVLLDEREQVLTRLGEVADSLAREWVGSATEATVVRKELSAAAAKALESQAELAARIGAERDRLAGVVRRLEQPDPVANYYAPPPARGASVVSVTG